jgi:hypothetical protein
LEWEKNEKTMKVKVVQDWMWDEERAKWVGGGWCTDKLEFLDEGTQVEVTDTDKFYNPIEGLVEINEPMKTAEQILDEVIEKLDKDEPIRSPYFSGITGVYDGNSEPILKAMHEFAEAERKRAFEAAVSAYDSPDTIGCPLTYEEFKEQNPLI